MKCQQLSKVIFVSRYLSFSTRRYYSATANVHENHDVVEYPPVKPRYPPGRWGKIAERSAWKLHERGEELLKIPAVKERLEKMAGEKEIIQYLVQAFDKRPNNTQFKQYITKTHIVNSLPDVYKDIPELTDNEQYTTFKRRIGRIVQQESNFHFKHQINPSVVDSSSFIRNVEPERYRKQHLLRGLCQEIVSYFSKSVPHLQRCQFDENVRVETFWRVEGFGGKDIPARGRCVDILDNKGKNAGVLNFQYKNISNVQIRTESRLQEFIPRNSSLCSQGDVPQVSYTPSAAGLPHIRERPLTVSGHWIGDPCEYAPLSLYIVPTKQYNSLTDIGHKYTDQLALSYAAVAGFGSCVAQAHNQGFTMYHDLTYPITTQIVLLRGDLIQFFSYQLNTFHLWRDNNANPLRNILWASSPQPLIKKSEDGVADLNDGVLRQLLRFFFLAPVQQAVEDRPYLPDEESPSNKKIYINHKGDEPLPCKKIERFQYPRNAVYF